MGLMEPGCNLEDFGRLVQPAATNRLRCRVNVVSERYLVEMPVGLWLVVCLAYAWFLSCCFVFYLAVVE